MQQAMSSQNENQQLSGQMQALNDSVDELKTRIWQAGCDAAVRAGSVAECAKPVHHRGPRSQQGRAPAGPGGDWQRPRPPGGNLAPQPTAGNGAGIAAPLQQTYQAALRDYNSAKYDLSNSEFSDVVTYYPQDDLAGNAHSTWRDRLPAGQVTPRLSSNTTWCWRQFAGNPKAPAAQLRKGASLCCRRSSVRLVLKNCVPSSSAIRNTGSCRGAEQTQRHGIRINSKPTAYRR